MGGQLPPRFRRLCNSARSLQAVTARDGGKGQEAVALLNAEGLSPKFHQLDITSQESIDALKEFVLEKYGGIDVLVNNAGTSIFLAKYFMPYQSTLILPVSTTTIKTPKLYC